jgi:hypothetical protein
MVVPFVLHIVSFTATLAFTAIPIVLFVTGFPTFVTLAAIPLVTE